MYFLFIYFKENLYACFDPLLTAHISYSIVGALFIGLYFLLTSFNPYPDRIVKESNTTFCEIISGLKID